MKPPLLSLCMIVAPTADEAGRLSRALWSIKGQVDEICVTVTGDCKEVDEVALQYGAKLSHIAWTDDFAAARNFNFSQATGDFIFWMDADDVCIGAKNLRRVARTMRKSMIDGSMTWYLYGFDEFGHCTVKHKKTRVIRNNGTWEWVGRLHEDLQPKVQARISMLDLKIEPTLYFELHHLTDDKRVNANAERNLRIAEKQLADEPDDPRNLWNVGNAQLMCGKDEEALVTLEAFSAASGSDDERYLALHRIAMTHLKLGDVDEARRFAHLATDVFPEYPDAWIGLGCIAYSQGKWKHAKEFLVQGLAKTIPDNIIVYDPLDYGQNPLVLLANCYFNLNKTEDAKRVVEKLVEMYPKNPDHKAMLAALEKTVADEAEVKKLVEKSKDLTDEQLKIELTLLPEDMQMHPLTCTLRNERFVRKETSGKRVDIYCGYTTEPWDETSVVGGIGGSEESVINLSRRFVKMGYEVFVYNNCKRHRDEHGVEWIPFWAFNVRDKFDTLVIWRHPKILDYKLNARKILLDLHDVLPPQELSTERMACVEKVMVKSKYHRSLFPKVPDDKFLIVSNGIDLSHFDQKVERQKHRMIYTSSPDRGLEHLLDAWPQIRKAVPDAELHVFYGWGVFDSIYGKDPKMIAWKQKIQEQMKQDGIVAHGRVGHREIAVEMMKSDIFAYPCHFEEIDCISMKKAYAAGALPQTTDYAALGEYPNNLDQPHKGQWTLYVKKLIGAMLGDGNTEAWRDNNKRLSQWWSWDEIAKQWPL